MNFKPQCIVAAGGYILRWSGGYVRLTHRRRKDPQVPGGFIVKLRPAALS